MQKELIDKVNKEGDGFQIDYWKSEKTGSEHISITYFSEGHYLNEINLSKEQLEEILKNFKK